MTDPPVHPKSRGLGRAVENATLTNASYNGTIAPSGSTTVGFQGTWTQQRRGTVQLHPERHHLRLTEQKPFRTIDPQGFRVHAGVQN